MEFPEGVSQDVSACPSPACVNAAVISRGCREAPRATDWQPGLSAIRWSAQERTQRRSDCRKGPCQNWVRGVADFERCHPRANATCGPRLRRKTQGGRSRGHRLPLLFGPWRCLGRPELRPTRRRRGAKRARAKCQRGYPRRTPREAATGGAASSPLFGVRCLPQQPWRLARRQRFCARAKAQWCHDRLRDCTWRNGVRPRCSGAPYATALATELDALARPTC